MKITEIYEKYKIPPILQIHQIRVAGVATIICHHFEKPINKNVVISACLLHDMGNILKFNFEIFPEEFYAPEGREYWKNVKGEFRKKYGSDEHYATLKIAKDIGVSKPVFKIISSGGFFQSKKKLLS